MKKTLPLLLIIAIAIISCSREKSLILDVMSLNIRYDNPGDAPNAWPDRKAFMLSYLQDEAPDILGLQEALWHQYHYLDSALVDYESIGAGRNDGAREGEMTPVFFRRDRFTVLNSSTFWLSETPAVPGSRGWGAVLPRIVTWVELQENSSGKRFFFFNTHYSHMSDSARLMSSGILLQQVEDIAGDMPFVITGDFNMLPDSRAYDRLTEGGSEESLIIDSYTISGSAPSGSSYTFNGFRDEEGRGRIDYIFVSRGAIVLSHETPSPKQGELFISDHWPVKATLEFRP
jgi:endonuclease/exonuclease/phosphatase family metal-dependent hydrolase